MNLQNIKYPRAATYYLILTIITLAVIFLVAINPAWKEKDRLESRISELELMIQEQKILYPVYASLAGKMQESPDLPDMIRDNNFSGEKHDVDDIIDILKEMAETEQIADSDFSPVPESLSRENNRLLINIKIEDDYYALRRFLARLSSSPVLINYDQIELNSRPQGMQCLIKAWIAVN